jgi:hypothetical protein
MLFIMLFFYLNYQTANIWKWKTIDSVQYQVQVIDNMVE